MNILRALLAGVVFVLAPSAVGQPTGRYHVREYNTEAFQAAFTNPLPPPVGEIEQMVVVYSIPLDGELKQGEILLVSCELKLHANSSGSVKTSAGIYLGTQPTYISTDDVKQYQISERNGENQYASAGLQDATYVKVGTYYFQDQTPVAARKFVNVYAFAKQASDIEVQSSRLSVLRFTPVTAPHHGWFMKSGVFEDDSPAASVASAVSDPADVVFTVDLDPNQDDPLKVGASSSPSASARQATPPRIPSGSGRSCGFPLQRRRHRTRMSIRVSRRPMTSR